MNNQETPEEMLEDFDANWRWLVDIHHTDKDVPQPQIGIDLYKQLKGTLINMIVLELEGQKGTELLEGDGNVENNAWCRGVNEEVESRNLKLEQRINKYKELLL